MWSVGCLGGGDREGRLGTVTELLYLRDAYLTHFSARVTGVREHAIALDRTAFYPTGGGQACDTGVLAGLPVIEVRKDGADVWHTCLLYTSPSPRD